MRFVGGTEGEVDEGEEGEDEDHEDEDVVLEEVPEELHVFELVVEDHLSVRQASVLGEGVGAELSDRLHTKG